MKQLKKEETRKMIRFNSLFLDETIESIFEKHAIETNLIPDFIGIAENYRGLSYELPERQERQWMKTGRFLTKYTLLLERQIAIVAREINEYLAKMSNNLNILITKDFDYCYDGEYTKTFDSGNLGCSCMRSYYEQCDDFYSSIPDLQIIHEIDNDDMIHSRALYWNTDKGIYLDRTYSIKDQYVIPCRYDHAYHENNEPNILVKTNFTFQDNFTYYDETFVPYLDTFYVILCDKTGQIYLSTHSNYEDLFCVGYGRSTDGYIEDYNEDLAFKDGEVINNRIKCESCGDYRNIDYMYQIEEGLFCGSCVAYSNHENRYIPYTQATYCEQDSDYYFSCDVVQDVNYKYIYVEHAVKFNGKTYHKDDMTETFDLLTVPINETCVIDDKIYWIHSEGVIFENDRYCFPQHIQQVINF